MECPVPNERQRAEDDDVAEDHRERDPLFVPIEPRPEIGGRYFRRVLDGGRRLHGAILTPRDALVRRTSLISTAARDRVKLAIDQCEEQFHVYDDKSSQDTLDSYEAALNRGKAMGFQEAAHYVKSALHDIDVKSL